MKAFLILEDGTIFEGKSFGAYGVTTGKVIFNTSMTGYQEILSDPSYYGQIIVATYPLIGNCGINEDEKVTPRAKGFVIREKCLYPDNIKSTGSLDEYLQKHNIIGIEDIDTRALVKIIQNKGNMRGIISNNRMFYDLSSKEKIKVIMHELKEFEIKNPVEAVTIKEPVYYEEEMTNLETNNIKKVALIDYGVKYSLINNLTKRGLRVFRFPADTQPDRIMQSQPDGIILSGGPGDPKDCTKYIKTISSLWGLRPIFGIGLGHQLAALANGANTTSLKCGHRGTNYPVKDLELGKTFITSQNHGYVVDAETIDNRSMKISHININDRTIEGIEYRNVPVFTVQFYPDAVPGPKDTEYLFDRFISLMKENSKHANT